LPIGTTLVELGPIPTEMLAHTDDYVPTAAAFRRFYRMRLAVDVPREKVADEVVEAVQKGRSMCGSPSEWPSFPVVRSAATQYGSDAQRRPHRVK